MIDGGQGFFKICLSIMPEDFISSSVDDSEYLIPVKKRRFSEGGSVGGSDKCTSVKKLFLLCIVPDIVETYENIKILFDLVKLNNISFKLLADFKLILIINGLQTAKSTYPCPYCFVTLQDLKTSIKNDKQYPLKTYGDLRRDYNKFSSNQISRKNARLCNSTVNDPLFNESDETLVIEKCVIPELHILLGFVNHLFFDGLVPLVGREKALIWPEKLCIVSKGYHGKVFEGTPVEELVARVSGEDSTFEIWLICVPIQRNNFALKMIQKGRLDRHQR